MKGDKGVATGILSLASVSILVFGLSGCQEASRRPMTATAPAAEKLPEPCEDIIHVALLVDLPLIDDDGDGRPDGAQIKVMLNRPNQPDYVPGRGALIVHLMKRQRDDSGKFHDTELYVWKVTPEKFAQAVVRQRFGLVCHQMALYWIGVEPEGAGVHLRAEFIRTDGKRLWSRPVTLSLPPASRRGY